MTPSNPSNSQPLIYRICDALGVFHIVAPVNHTHTQSEVDGLTTALAGKQDVLTFDSTPTAGSTNPVTSSGLASALSRKASVSSVNYDEFTKSDDEEKIDLALVMSDSTQKNYILKNISNNNFNVSDFFEDANIYFTNDAAVNRDHFAFVKIIKEDNGSMIQYYVITEGIIGL